MNLTIPESSFVVLIGAPDSGKDAFVQKHFSPEEIASADRVEMRLAAGLLTAVDATDLRGRDRHALISLARKYHIAPVAITFTHAQLPTKETLENEGLRTIHHFSTAADAAAAQIIREPLACDLRHEHGPFDIIGDVHGCHAELVSLLTHLGYTVDPAGHTATPPPGHKAIFLGDLVDRGPGIASVLRLVMRMTADGHALCVPGNHDSKLLRKLLGHDVKISAGLQQSLDQLAREPADFTPQVAAFIESLASHYLLDDGRLVVAHAGLPLPLHGRNSRTVRQLASHGENTGEIDAYGLPERYEWARDYHGNALVVYGHTPVREPQWINHTLNIDTGCVFGGRLTAYRYPENTFATIPARETYAITKSRFAHATPASAPSEPEKH